MTEPIIPISKERISQKKFTFREFLKLREANEKNDIDSEESLAFLAKNLKNLSEGDHSDFIHDSRVFICIKNEILNGDEPTLRSYLSRPVWAIEFFEFIVKESALMEPKEGKRLTKEIKKGLGLRLNFEDMIYSEAIYEKWRPKVIELLNIKSKKELFKILGDNPQNKMMKILKKFVSIEKNSEFPMKKILEELFSNCIIEDKSLLRFSKMCEIYARATSRDNNKQELDDLSRKFGISQEESEKLDIETETITQLIRNNVNFSGLGLKNVHVMCMGSFTNGFATKGSDIDITILTNCFVNERKLLKYIEDSLCNEFPSNKLRCLYTKKIRIPLIRIETTPHVDILINNVLGVLNSKMLKIYSELDDRVKPLVVLLKTWGKQSKLIDERYLPSYGLTLLVIYFLQLKRILPSLQRISKEERKKSGYPPTFMNIRRISTENTVQDFKTRVDYETDPVKIRQYMDKTFPKKNKENLCSLLQGFFKFYKLGGNFHKFNMRCNVKKGEIDFKKYKEESNIRFSIIDPFDKEHNPGFKTYLDKENIKELENAEKLVEKCQFKELFKV